MAHMCDFLEIKYIQQSLLSIMSSPTDAKCISFEFLEFFYSIHVGFMWRLQNVISNSKISYELNFYVSSNYSVWGDGPIRLI